MASHSEPITRVIEIDAPLEYVFDFIVQPENLVRWMGTEASFDARPGGKVRIVGCGVVTGTVVEVIRPHRVVFTWGWEGQSGRVPPESSVVEVTLEPTERGTRLTLVHRNLSDDVKDQHNAGWIHYLDRLKTAAEGGDPGPDPLSFDLRY